MSLARAQAARAEAARAEAAVDRAAQDTLRMAASAAKIDEARRLCQTALGAARKAQQAAETALNTAESAVNAIPAPPGRPSAASIKAAALARGKSLLAQARAQIAGAESCVRQGVRRAKDYQAAVDSAKRYEARAKRLAAQAQARVRQIEEAL